MSNRSISVDEDVYDKVVADAKAEERTISKQASRILREHYKEKEAGRRDAVPGDSAF